MGIVGGGPYTPVVSCPRCGEQNPSQARFCSACGEPLATTPATLEERKTVSVLFVDLVGFTARSDEADPEVVRATLRPYHALLKREIERFGGTVEKFIGDAVMAVFGAPVAHEDDPERAVRAALRIADAIDELNGERPGLDLAVRAAVTTGVAIVAVEARPELGEGLVAGDVVNTASRLQGEAPAGGVVVDEATLRATASAIDHEALEPVLVKGKTQPIPIWLATGARSSFGVDVERPDTAFVGREADLEVLRRSFLHALQEPAVQLVVVTGEPGVGKTRLVSEFRAWVDDRPEIVSWRQGRCLPYGEGVTFWALGELVKAHAGILESDTPDEASAKLADAIGAVAAETDREWLLSCLAPLVGAAGDEDASTDRGEAFAAWRTFLEAVAGARPLVLVLEDLHWADQPLLEFVDDLVDFGSGVPLLLVCTARPELHERAPGWGLAKRNGAVVSLAPLSSDETARLISSLLEQAVLPATTQANLLERAGGNPLYTEEFVRMLVDQGVLRRRGDAWTVVEDGVIAVPDTVQAIITSRIDRLPADRKVLLQDAAVVGKVFWAGAVAAMAGASAATVSEGLRDLARRDLIRPARRSSIATQAEYAFRHMLVRDVAYEQIPRGSRAARHLGAADWIEAMAGGRVADQAELLVHHCERALEAVRGTGSKEVGELERRTGRFLVLAGDRARQLDAERSFDSYVRALELFAADDPDRPAVLVEAAGVATNLGRYQSAVELLEEALRAAEAGGRRDDEAQILAELGSVYWNAGDTARERLLTARAMEVAWSASPTPAIARAFRRIAGILTIGQGRPREGLAWSERALPMAERFGLRREYLMELHIRGIARCTLGDQAGLEDLRESLQACLDGGLLREAVLVSANAGWWTFQAEGPAPGLELQDEAAGLGDRVGQLHTAMWSRAESTAPLYDLGEWDELIRRADVVSRWDRDTGGTQMLTIVLPQKARVLLLRGQAEAAHLLEGEFLATARAIRDPQVYVPALAAAATVEATRGDLMTAVRLVDELELVLADRAPPGPRHVLDCLRVLIQSGAVDRARGFLARERETWGPYEVWFVSGEAALAEAAGDHESAVGLFRDAAARWDRIGNVAERAHALCGAGRCLIASDRATEADEAFAEARATFAGLGATVLVTAIDSASGSPAEASGNAGS